MAELALAVVAFADQCLKYGNKFVKRCKSYLHAGEETVELLISIEINWVKMEAQIGILKRVAEAGGLDKKLQDMQAQVLSQLEGKLKTASLIIEQLMNEKREEEKAKKEKWKHDDRDIKTVMKGLGDMRATTKLKYTSKKKALYDIVDDIEKWQKRYDPTWILIMQMSLKHIDEELNEQERRPKRDQVPIIIAAKGIRDAAKATQDTKVRDQRSIWILEDDLDLIPTQIPNSSVEISILDDEKGLVLIDTMVSNPAANVNSTTKEVRNLARILAEVDPSTFGLLQCRGVIKVPKDEYSLQPLLDYKFIFNVPRGLESPQSLRAVLLSGTSYPLDERLELAKKLTNSVLFVHTVQFVHKNIRPETIVVFKNEHSDIGAPFLAGFERFRIEDGNTYLAGDDMWDHNLYRHPSRQGTLPEMHCQMQHDIYSLGVVLLEIGLWSSFVIAPSAGGSVESNVMSSPNQILLQEESHDTALSLGSAFETKIKLEALAKTELPPRLGRRYAEIVLSCLRCLDKETSTDDGEDEKAGFGIDDAGSELTDEDGIVIGVRYIENVLQKMQEITL